MHIERRVRQPDSHHPGTPARRVDRRDARACIREPVRHPSRYIVAMGRSAGGTIVALDHVAKVQDGQIPLAPAFHAPNGRYRVSAYRVRASRGAESQPVAPPKEVAWPPTGDDAQLPLPEAGLYQIVLETTGQTSAATAARALAETAARQAVASAQLAAFLRTARALAETGWSCSAHGARRRAGVARVHGRARLMARRA